MSRYDINNALLKKYMPLSYHIHGPFKMMQPELLHTFGSGLIMYMIEPLCEQIGGGKTKHLIISNIMKQQTESNFPRRSMHNRLIDGTKCQSSKRKSILYFNVHSQHNKQEKFKEEFVEFIR
jgi:hypothetical protein